MASESETYDQLRSLFPQISDDLLFSVMEANHGKFEESLNDILQMDSGETNSPRGKKDRSNQSPTTPRSTQRNRRDFYDDQIPAGRVGTSEDQIKRDEKFARELEARQYMDEITRSSDGPNVADAIGNLGGAAKKKFNDLYNKFSSRKGNEERKALNDNKEYSSIADDDEDE